MLYNGVPFFIIDVICYSVNGASRLHPIRDSRKTFTRLLRYCIDFTTATGIIELYILLYIYKVVFLGALLASFSLAGVYYH